MQTIRNGFKILVKQDIFIDFFNYGNFPILLAAMLLAPVYIYLKIAGGFPEFGPFLSSTNLWFTNYAEILLVPRLAWVVIQGIALVAVVFLANKVAGTIAGFSAGVLVAVNPWLAFNSSRVVVDGLASSLAWISFALCFEAWERRKPGLLYFAGALLGFATATKYTYGATFLALAILLFTMRPRVGLSQVVKLLATSGAAFLVPMYSAWLNFEDFFAALVTESEHYKTGHLGATSEPWFGQLYFQLQQFWLYFGVVGLLLAMSGSYFILTKNSLWRIPLLAVTLPFLVMMFVLLSGRVNFHRNLLGIYPLLAIFSGIAISFISSALQSTLTSNFRRTIPISLLLILATVLQPLWLQTQRVIDNILYREPRTLALQHALHLACEKSLDVIIDTRIYIVTRGSSPPCQSVNIQRVILGKPPSSNLQPGVYVIAENDLGTKSHLTEVQNFPGNGPDISVTGLVPKGPLAGLSVSTGIIDVPQRDEY